MGRGVRPPRRVPGCLAHLLSEGEGLTRRRRAPSSARGAGRGNRAGANTRTERTLLFKVCISKVHLRREKERLTPATLRVAHAAWRGDGPDLCVDAVGRLERVPRGLAHAARPPRRVPRCLAHLLSSTGGPRAAGAGLIQCTGRGASESGGCGQTDGEDTPFQGLYSESAPSARLCLYHSRQRWQDVVGLESRW